ncbi:MAG: hypothetical protein JO160_00355 [Candidatus Eremiobacteraeota bacterium]|nr:hypothetical protein [Candidatus Eremiobacteraeota bacterium]
MKTERLIDPASAQALDFAWLARAVEPAGEYGRRAFEELRPFVPGQEAAAFERASRIALLASAADEERLDAVRDVLRQSPDATGAIARASMGDVLDDAQLFELQRFCDAIERTGSLLAGVAGIESAAGDAIRSIARVLEPGRSGKYGFYLADAFAPEVSSARAALVRAQAELDAVRGRAVARVGLELGRDDVAGDEFIVMRASVGKLPAGVRVLREAATYFLCAIEYDDAALAALARRDEAAANVAAAEENVRAKLSAQVRERAAELDRAARTLGEIDVLVSAARFTREHDCVPAAIVDRAALEFEAGRFLPMAGELEVQGRRFTPIDVALHDVAVLTGPNMGGKSVCLRTCGFIAMCASFGLPAPARRAATALFEEIAWLGIGTDEDPSGGSLLSSFAREVVRLREVLERKSARTLVLVDEFARTTTPAEGKALLAAAIEALRARGACGMAATHLAGVAAEAGARHFAVRGLRGIPDRPSTGDLHEAMAALADSMDYTIAEVGSEDPAGRADAIALASLLGLERAVVEAAYGYLKK